MFTFSILLLLSIIGTASSNALCSHTLDIGILCLVCLWPIKHYNEWNWSFHLLDFWRNYFLMAVRPGGHKCLWEWNVTHPVVCVLEPHMVRCNRLLTAFQGGRLHCVLDYRLSTASCLRSTMFGSLLYSMHISNVCSLKYSEWTVLFPSSTPKSLGLVWYVVMWKWF